MSMTQTLSYFPMQTLGSSHSQEDETLRPGADHQSYWQVQADGPQVLLELLKSQPQGWCHDPGGTSARRHGQELRLHRGRAKGRSHGLQAVGTLIESHPSALLLGGSESIRNVR